MIEGETHEDNNQLEKTPKSTNSAENMTPCENKEAAHKTDDRPGKSTRKAFERTQSEGNLSKNG